MKCRGLAVMLALVLASSCGGAPDEPDQAVRQTSRPIPCSVADSPVDPEPIARQTILAFGDSLFAGYGLCDDQGYPERLHIALNERHVDAAVIDAAVSGDTSAAGLQRFKFV